MNLEIEDFKTGWFGVCIGLDISDIDKLIHRLNMLKNDESYHFHIFETLWKTEPGIADIEFSRKIEGEIPHMQIE